MTRLRVFLSQNLLGSLLAILPFAATGEAAGITGHVDLIDGYGNLHGWACSPGNASPLIVNFFLDSPTGASLGSAVANMTRGDLLTVCNGSTAHGYSFPIPYVPISNGAHTIYAQAVNTTTSPSSLVPVGSTLTPSVSQMSSVIQVLQSSVFDPYLYLGMNPDLTQPGVITSNGVVTPAQAAQHWLQYGMKACRRAQSTFSVQDYLSKYPDVNAKYGLSNCPGAILQFVQSGLAAGRSGTIANSVFGAVPGTPILNPSNSTAEAAVFGNEVMTLGASMRVAGAIDSLVLNGVNGASPSIDFINTHDHGRLIATAYNNDGMGQCNNPTEGGSIDDYTGPKSTSELQSMSAGPNPEQASVGYQSSVLPAFWFTPAEASTPGAPGCPNPASTPNTTSVATGQPMSKSVTLGFMGDPNIINYGVTISNPPATFQAQVPATYLNYQFTNFYEFVPSDNIASPLDMTTAFPLNSAGAYTGSTGYPVIHATADGTLAMGFFSGDQYGMPANYALGDFLYNDKSVPSDSINTVSSIIAFKWPPSGIAANQGYNVSAPSGSVSFQTLMIVGSLAQVQQKMSWLSQVVPNSMAPYAFDHNLYDALYDSKINPTQTPMPAPLVSISNHWKLNGIYQGFRPSIEYNPAYIMSTNAALALQFKKNYGGLHNYYIASGVEAGMRASLEFDPVFYQAGNPSLSGMTFLQLANHWATQGLAQGWDGSADFSPSAYLNRYSDVLSSCGSSGYYCATLNWITTGQTARRIGHR